MIIGASDSGKSTVARYLYQELCRHGVRVAYLAADVGQSTLGLPTTLNASLADEPGDGRFPPEGAHASYFVGSTTPRGHMLPSVIGAFRLQQWALAMGANAVVVDTTGLVDKAQGGKALKQWKIELLAPDVVIGLYREQELEPILWPLRRDRRVRCIELPASPHALARPRESRIALPVEREAIERLRTIPEFVRSYEPDGMAPDEFIAYGASQRTLSQFNEIGWAMLEAFDLDALS